MRAATLSPAAAVAGDVHARYLLIPGLRLTQAQVRRVWSLDAVTCEALLDALIDIRFLRRTPEGANVRERAD
jgi:hypothetical protein